MIIDRESEIRVLCYSSVFDYEGTCVSTSQMTYQIQIKCKLYACGVFFQTPEVTYSTVCTHLCTFYSDWVAG